MQETPLSYTRSGEAGSRRPRIGIALGSGIARGFAHIGALKALDRRGLRPDVMAGTSIGALAGACWMAGKLKNLEAWGLSLNRRKLIALMDFKIRSGGLIGGKRLQEQLEQNFGQMRVEDLPVPFVAVASDMVTGHEVWLRKGLITEILHASYALPGLFPPAVLENRFLVDGALVNPVPVAPLLALGAQLTIAIDLSGDMVSKSRRPGTNVPTAAGFDLFDAGDVPADSSKPFQQFSLTRRLFRRDPSQPSLFGTMVSAFNIVQDRVTRSRLAGDPPDIHIKPRLGHIGMMEFERAEELMQEGEDAVERAWPDIERAITALQDLSPMEGV